MMQPALCCWWSSSFMFHSISVQFILFTRKVKFSKPIWTGRMHCVHCTWLVCLFHLLNALVLDAMATHRTATATEAAAATAQATTFHCKPIWFPCFFLLLFCLLLLTTYDCIQTHNVRSLYSYYVSLFFHLPAFRIKRKENEIVFNAQNYWTNNNGTSHNRSAYEFVSSAGLRWQANDP